MSHLIKGYKKDAGADIVLEHDVSFPPLATTVVNLNIRITPVSNEVGFLFARTSAAKDGLVVNSCPIDPDYTGDVYAIVHNVSNKEVTYKAGSAFCQIVMMPFHCNVDVPFKKMGDRSNGNFGSTGG